jgi:cellulose biosynthesis protein BcsQ
VIPTLGFCSGKAGVGTTSLVYHLAWLYAEQGYRVLAVDLDPQVDLTAKMVDEEQLAALWGNAVTLARSLIDADPAQPGIVLPREPIAGNLELLVGDLRVSWLEPVLAAQWERCLQGDPHALGVTMGFAHRIQQAASDGSFDVVVVDLGPSPSAVNRAALLACQYLIVPMAPDLFSMQGLQTLALELRSWDAGWREWLPRNRAGIEVPGALAQPVGYVVRLHPLRLDHPAAPAQPSSKLISEPPGTLDGNARSALGWWSVLPDVYATSFRESNPAADPSSDPRCLGTLQWYGSLMPMALEARKPIFQLRPADGALGAHGRGVREARKNYEQMAARIAAATWRPASQKR